MMAQNEQEKMKYSDKQYDEILYDLLDAMLDGVQEAIEKGWIPKTATPKDRVVSGIMHIVCQELGKANERR